MQAVADALSLMANIVMAWNTSQMQAVLDRWSNRRQVIPPELIGKIAPTRLDDLPPLSRTNRMEVRSVNQENDGYEEESIYRATDRWLS